MLNWVSPSGNRSVQDMWHPSRSFHIFWTPCSQDTAFQKQSESLIWGHMQENMVFVIFIFQKWHTQWDVLDHSYLSEPVLGCFQTRNWCSLFFLSTPSAFPHTQWLRPLSSTFKLGSFLIQAIWITTEGIPESTEDVIFLLLLMSPALRWMGQQL